MGREWVNRGRGWSTSAEGMGGEKEGIGIRLPVPLFSQLRLGVLAAVVCVGPYTPAVNHATVIDTR